MKVIRTFVPTAMGIFVVLAAPTLGQNKDEESREKPIQLAQVPQAARDAAQKALGTAPTEAKIVSGTSPQEYELEATAKSGKEMSVHVRADGKLVKKEREENEGYEKH